MKKLTLALCLVGAALLTTACVNTSTANRPRPPLKAIADAPEFELRSVTGGQVTSQSLKGKIVVVDFWATWCVPCKIEVPEYSKMQARLKDHDVKFLGVTFDSGTDLEEIQGYMKELGMEYPAVMGTDAVNAGFGGYVGLPTTFLIGRDWKVYRKIMGSTEKKMQHLEEDIMALIEKSAG
jgi:thiol-disulfide isomerase/thioredoxin